jgi:hypothetical protein
MRPWCRDRVLRVLAEALRAGAPHALVKWCTAVPSASARLPARRCHATRWPACRQRLRIWWSRQSVNRWSRSRALPRGLQAATAASASEHQAQAEPFRSHLHGPGTPIWTASGDTELRRMEGRHAHSSSSPADQPEMQAMSQRGNEGRDGDRWISTSSAPASTGGRSRIPFAWNGRDGQRRARAAAASRAAERFVAMACSSGTTPVRPSALNKGCRQVALSNSAGALRPRRAACR